MFARRRITAAVPHVFEERKSKDFDDAREPRKADAWGRHTIRICPGRPSGQVSLRVFYSPLITNFLLSSFLCSMFKKKISCRMFAPSEDSDWEETFLSVIRPASSSTPAPSSSGRGEDEDTSEKKDQEQDQKPNEVKNSNRLNASNSQPIELLNENSQVVEVDVPVMEGVPSGSFKPLWSQEFISCTSPTSHRCVPLYKVEGREDPEKDEGFNEPESPFKSSPMLSGEDGSSADRESSQNDTNNSQEGPSESPNHPENFFDDCDILQWVINDSNISDPNILNTSPTPSSDDEHRPTATTTRFISELKRDSSTPSAEGATSQPTNRQFAVATKNNSSSTTADDLHVRMMRAAKPETPENAANELHQSVIQALKTNPSAVATAHAPESLASQLLGIEVAGPSNILPANSHEPADQQSALPEGLYNTLSLDPEIKSEPDPDWEYQPPKPTGSRWVDFLMMTNWEMLIKALIIYFTIFAIFMHIAVKHDVMESMKF